MASETEVKLPNIGDFEEVEVIELLVKPGDRIEVEQALLVLESDKATMEIPSPVAGVLARLLVGVGDKISEGRPIARIEVEGEGATPGEAGARAAQAAPAGAAQPAGSARPDEAEKPVAPAPAARTATPSLEPEADEGAAPTPADLAPYATAGAAIRAHASPSVRRLARELGVELDLVPGSGPKGRIRPEDVQGYVKALVSQRGAAAVPIAGVHVAAPVEVDFAKWGPVASEPLNRVRRVAAANLHRSWVTVPHVTQHDEADVTELEAFREEHRAEAGTRGVKLTFLPFVVKAAVKALQELPHFNASLDHTGEHLVVKRYYHIGVAVDTEHGLVVPVVRDADRKGLYELAAELQDLSARARERRLRPEHLQGGSFSISSLGGIGGSFFTPIVNHPEVAILGVSRTQWRPVWQGGAFVPRRVLPLSLSYDHRVIDGADAARFTTRLAALLGDLRRVLL
ncbi:MAG: dihydrolipoyllysine-residue acetyltransferase [Deltaproteobacteria bacterium]|nr:dihydrolipoyllysine-residue acetyltransferase [Deltaproteobacteria bacterium]